jgi:DNA polymerase-3 subunit alpha
MAAVLSNNMSDLKKSTLFMDEARRMGISVLGPDVNESRFKFAVNEGGAIRFGLGAMKGVGEGAVRSIMEHRVDSVDAKGVEKLDAYTSIFDFSRRVSLKDCNKRVFEALALGGAFDDLSGHADVHRAQFFALDQRERSLIELAIKYGQALKASEDSAQVSLFGGTDEVEIPEPMMQDCEPWTDMVRLNHEKDVVGIYISGHPLDLFRFELDNFTTKNGLALLEDMDKLRGKKLQFGGLVSKVEHRISRAGKPWGTFSLEDYFGAFEFKLFSDDYLSFKQYMVDEWMIIVSGVVQKKRSWGDSEVDPGSEFKVTKMEMLAESREKRLERVRINLNLNALDNGWIDKLEKVIKSSKGKVGLTIDIFDGKDKIVMPSRNTQVGVTNDFITQLNGLCTPGVAKYRFDIKKA